MADVTSAGIAGKKMNTAVRFTNGTLVTLSPPRIEQADLRVADGKIVAKAAQLAPQPDEQVYDLAGKLLMPGMVCAHTHLYSALARGMPGPAEAPANFLEILQQVWWRLDKALDEEAVEASAVVGVLDALRSGTTTIIDHHASPGYLQGSLEIMRDVFERFGMRGVLCYEVTDRGGEQERDMGIAENRWLLDHQSDLVKGLVGAHAAFTLSDDSLRRCADLVREYQSGLHIHVAEGRCDVDTSLDRYGMRVIPRLHKAGLLNERSLLVHGVHLTHEEIQQVQDCGGWLVHNPRSNMNNAVGYAPVPTFGTRVALGTDGITSNMFEEAKFMFFKAQDAKAPISAEDCVRVLAGGAQIASDLFGLPPGSLEVGAAADLIVLDYPSPTPLHEGNLAGHLIFGLSHAHVVDVMVNGQFPLQNIDVTSLYHKAQQTAAKLWERMQQRI